MTTVTVLTVTVSTITALTLSVEQCTTCYCLQQYASQHLLWIPHDRVSQYVLLIMFVRFLTAVYYLWMPHTTTAIEGKGIDWATAESLAFGTLLLEVMYIHFYYMYSVLLCCYCAIHKALSNSTTACKTLCILWVTHFEYNQLYSLWLNTHHYCYCCYCYCCRVTMCD
jgi:hypothetical protein